MIEGETSTNVNLICNIGDVQPLVNVFALVDFLKHKFSILFSIWINTLINNKVSLFLLVYLYL